MKIIESTLKHKTVIFADSITTIFISHKEKEYYGVRGYAVKIELKSGSLYCLGVYDTPERANEVLESILNFISSYNHTDKIEYDVKFFVPEK